MQADPTQNHDAGEEEQEPATVRTLASFAYDCFGTARRATGDTATGPREDGEPYVRVIEGSPGWITDLCYHAHGDFMPDDWRYRAIWDALEVMMEADDLDDAQHEYADGMVDVYTGARLAWLSSNLRRLAYCDDASEEMGLDRGSDGEYGRGGGDSTVGITDRIAAGQYQEASEVFELVRSFLERLDLEPSDIDRMNIKSSRTDAAISGDDSAGSPDHNRGV